MPTRRILALLVALVGMFGPAVALALCFGLSTHVDPSKPLHLAALIGALVFGVLGGYAAIQIDRGV